MARRFLLLFVTTLVATGCGDSDESGGPEVECRLNSDCELGATCEDGRCRPMDVCEDASCPCSTDADCGASLCDVERGACFDPDCQLDLDCPLGESCVIGRCITDVQADRDRDGVPDGSPSQPRDNCPDLPNPDQDDLDNDGLGDRCDSDVDGDGVNDPDDNCPRTRNPSQIDGDGDGTGDACSGDIDADGIPDTLDNCPQAQNPDQADIDMDDIGDACDDDNDNDTINDNDDNCPQAANTDQLDSDDDGWGDVCDQNVGEACEAGTMDCSMVEHFGCLFLPGGYCTGPCTTDEECQDSICVLGPFLGGCQPACKGNEDCRDGYVCVPPRTNAPTTTCQPTCSDDDDCSLGPAFDEQPDFEHFVCLDGICVISQ